MPKNIVRFITSHSQVQQLVTQEQELLQIQMTSDIMEITPTPGIYVCRGNIYVLLDLCTYLSCFIKVFMSSTLLITLFLKFLYCTQDQRWWEKCIWPVSGWKYESTPLCWEDWTAKILRMREDDALLVSRCETLFINTMFYEGERDEETNSGSLPFHFSESRGHGIFLAGNTRQKNISVCLVYTTLSCEYQWGTMNVNILDYWTGCLFTLKNSIMHSL